jgi:hypothetical protein
MKSRSEWLCYVLLLFTNGLFAFIWIFLLMRDVNRLAGRRVFPAGGLLIVLAAGFLIYLAVLIFPRTLATELALPQGYSFAAVFSLAVSFLVFLMTVLILIYRRSKLALGQPFGAIDVLKTIGLSVVMFLSFIMVQQQVNRWQHSKFGAQPGTG